MKNTLRTTMLMAAMTALFLIIGYLIGGETGVAIAFLFAAGSNLFAYWNSDKMLLRMYGARAVDSQSAPELVHLVEQLSRKAGLPVPQVYIVDQAQPNAFATGRNPQHAAVCVTRGLLARVNDEELAGVLAHELSHVKNHDTLTMTITATIAGAVSMLASFAFFMGGRRNPLGFVGVLLVTLIAPFAAMLVQMAVSRAREFEADHSGAELSGRPLWLASALRRIEAGRGSDRQSGRRREPCDGAYVHRQPARGQRPIGIVRQSSFHPRANRAVGSDGEDHGTNARESVGVSHAGIPARAAALSILSEVLRRRRPLDAVLDDILPSLNLPQRDAGFARAIVSETLRRFGVLDALIRSYVPKQPPPHKSGPTVEILLAGACELLFLNVSDHAAVDAANRLAALDKKAVHFKPLINATLRRVAREGRETLAKLDAERLSVPDWLWPRWLETYGEQIARAIARAHLVEPPLDIVLKNGTVLPDGEPLFGNVVRFKSSPRVDEMPGFDEGRWWVQDCAATLPARACWATRRAAPSLISAQRRGGKHRATWLRLAPMSSPWNANPRAWRGSRKTFHD